MIKFRQPATDIVIFTIEEGLLKVLLINRENTPFKNYWALPGGFIHEKESPETAALRVLKDKAGLSNVYIEQLYTFAASGRDPRGDVITVTHFALIPADKAGISGKKNVQTPTFYPLKKLPKLAFDHDKIINYAVKRLQAKLEYTNVIYSLLPMSFSFNELQKAYETILDRKLDKRNFRKKFMQLGLIRATDKIQYGTRQRPAQLYKFISRKPSELKKFF